VVVVVTRLRVEDAGTGDDTAFRAELQTALETLADRSGYVEGRIGRNIDDPTLWLLTTTWVDVGSYRRALSSYEVKVGVVPLLSRAVDEPSVYESAEPGNVLNQPGARGLPERRR
jgi:hypothetical protein